MPDDDADHIYQSIRAFTPEEVDMLLAQNAIRSLLYVPIGVSLHSDDLKWAEGICVRLSSHDDPTVRGNAVLGFSHLARRFGALNMDVVGPIIQGALIDPSEYVRKQAADANYDVQHYLNPEKWET